MLTSNHPSSADKFGLKAGTIERINAVFAQHSDVEEAILYGSRAKGTHREGSDIDLTLRGAALTHRKLLRIEAEIDDLLLPYLVDISLFDQIENPDLIEHIKRIGVTFYRQTA